MQAAEPDTATFFDVMYDRVHLGHIIQESSLQLHVLYIFTTYWGFFTSRISFEQYCLQFDRLFPELGTRTSPTRSLAILQLNTKALLQPLRPFMVYSTSPQKPTISDYTALVEFTEGECFKALHKPLTTNLKPQTLSPNFKPETLNPKP